MARRAYQPGETLGPYKILMTERIIGENGKPSPKGTFICPECGGLFVSYIASITTGTKRCCKECGKARHANPRKAYRDGDSIGPYSITLIRRVLDTRGRKTQNGIFLCPECGREFQSTIRAISQGIRACCPECTRRDNRPGDRIGSHHVLMLRREKLPNGNWSPVAIFECVECGNEFEAPVSSVSRTRNGIYRCSECARQTFMPGDHVGPHAILMTERGVSSDGHVSPRATFICPECNREFEARVTAVGHGRQWRCHDCSSVKYVAGTKIGPEKILLVKRLFNNKEQLTNKGIFVCPECHQQFEEYLYNVSTGLCTMCQNCRQERKEALPLNNPPHKYAVGTRVGPYNLLIVNRNQNADGKWNSRATFQCPICMSTFESEITDIASGRRHCCSDCLRKENPSIGKKTTRCYQPGDTVGPYGLVLVSRKRHTNGSLDIHGSFICPECGDKFEADIQSVARGQKKICNKCSSQRVYEEGHCYGPNKNVLLVHRAETAVDKDLWECPYCHETFYAQRYSIGTGKITSCGCYRSKASSERLTKDLTNQRFGRLTAIKIDEEYELIHRDTTQSGPHIWLCQCDCGGQIRCTTTQLVSGLKRHCGCQRNVSLGEDLIMEILEDAGIEYETEWTHPDCHMPNSTHPLRFDFKLVGANILIEFDGEQHYHNKTNCFEYFSGSSYASLHQRDLFKNEWCRENGYFLVRIPYSEYSHLIKHPDILIEWLSGNNLPCLPEYDEIPIENPKSESD